MPAKGQLSGYFINCDNCGKEIYQTKTQYNRAKHHFCGESCKYEFQHNEKYEDRKCEICGESFHAPIRSAQRFCSTKCQNKWQSTLIGILNPKSKRSRIVCEWCGKDFFEQEYKLKDGRHNFCSKECRRGLYSNVFSQSEEWKALSRKRAIKILESKQLDTNTKPQQIINSLLDDLRILYINEKGFQYYAVDNYLSEFNLVIEVMGDFWHCNPLKYSAPNNYEIHRKRIPKDRAKHTYFKKYYGIEILYLWENDIYNNLDVCKSLIIEYINNNGVLNNYHSFNYHMKGNNLTINKNIVVPYQDTVNA